MAVTGGESVAGTTGLIKTLLILQNNAIPPHVGIKTEINPRFPKDFDKRNLHIAFTQTDWPRYPGKKRIAAIKNFGAAGGNTTMIVEEAPTRIIEDSRCMLSPVSAKNKTSLAGNIERLQAWRVKPPETSLADLSYTTTARRQHYNHRVAVTATDLPGLQKELAKKLATADSHRPIPKSGAPPLAFCFTHFDHLLSVKAFHP